MDMVQPPQLAPCSHNILVIPSAPTIVGSAAISRRAFRLVVLSGLTPQREYWQARRTACARSHDDGRAARRRPRS
ncbi:MAG: hypothetical protein ACK5AT_06615, partial [Bradyrhizobium sp.]